MRAFLNSVFLDVHFPGAGNKNSGVRILLLPLLFLSVYFLHVNSSMKRQRGYSTASTRPPKRRRLAKRTLATTSRTIPRSFELKYKDTGLNTYVANTTGQFVLLNGIGQGTDADDRVGRKLVIKNIQIRAMIRTEGSETMGASSQPASIVQMLLVWDKQPNGAAPLITQLLEHAHPVSPIKMDNRDRFRILARKTWTIGAYIRSNTATQSLITTAQNQTHMKCYKKVNLETIYNSVSAADITTITSGALWMIWLGNQGSSLTNPQIPCSARIRYNDS